MNKAALTACTAIVVLASCSSDSETGGMGQVKILLESDTSVTVAEQTRNGDTSLSLTAPSLNEFSLEILNENGTTYKQWADASVYSPEFMPAGNYTADVLSGDPSEDAFDNPCFAGSASFTVVNGEEQVVTLTASLANTAARVGYTQRLQNYFQSYTTTIETDKGSVFVFADADADRDAYFTADSFTVTLTYTKNGLENNYSATVVNVAVRTLYNITFDINQDVGTPSIIINFKDDLPEGGGEINVG